jgi:hypothetical protein
MSDLLYLPFDWNIASMKFFQQIVFDPARRPFLVYACKKIFDFPH